MSKISVWTDHEDDHHLFFELEISLNVVDISNEAECRRYEGEHARAVSTSSTHAEEKPSATEEKPTSLFVSNWSDDEKCKRSKVPFRLVNGQVENRYQ